MNDNKTPIVQMCGCGHPVRVPAVRAMDAAEPARHIGIPGEPVACPKQ